MYVYSYLSPLHTSSAQHKNIYIPFLGKVFMDHSQKAKNIEKKGRNNNNNCNICKRKERGTVTTGNETGHCIAKDTQQSKIRINTYAHIYTYECI